MTNRVVSWFEVLPCPTRGLFILTYFSSRHLGTRLFRKRCLIYCTQRVCTRETVYKRLRQHAWFRVQVNPTIT